MKSKITYLLLSLVIAFALWFYVITVVSPESEEIFYNVPVILENEDVLKSNGFMLVKDQVPTVTLRLKGNRVDLNELKQGDIDLRLDLATVYSAGDKSLPYSIDFKGGKTFAVVEQNPKVLDLTFKEWAYKELFIDCTTTGDVPGEYISDEPKVEPSSITITGPKEVIEQITQAKINVNLDGVTQTIKQSMRYTLCDKDGNPVDASQVTANPAEVMVEIPVRRVKIISMSDLLQITYGGGATAENSSVQISPEHVKLSGSEKALENMTLTPILVDLSRITENTSFVYVLKIPDNVKNESDIYEFTVTITVPDVKKITINQITEINKDDGVTVTVGEFKKEIILRGDADQLEAITAEDIITAIDCRGAAAGENQYTITFKLPEAFNKVAVVGTYTVLATVGGTG